MKSFCNEKISIVSSVFNEEKNLKILLDRIKTVFDKIDYEYEIILINDGSTDRSLEIMKQIIQSNFRVKIIDLSRNFGNQIAVSSGFDYATGDALITLDSDLQHPPELIPELIKKWKEGYEIVLSKRKKHKHSIFGKLYFLLISKISNLELKSNISDYRLLDKKVVKELRRFPERDRFVRGIVSWVGFKITFVSFDVQERKFGNSKFNFFSLIRLGFSSIRSFSYIPLKLGLVSGLLIFFSSLILFVYMILDMYFFHMLNARPSAYFAVLNTVMLGFVLVVIGVIGEYLQTIHTEALGRPLYIIRELVNFQNDKEIDS